MSTDFTLDHSHKSYPFHQGPMLASALAGKAWNVLADDLSFPLAVIRDDALAHNLAWMQSFAERKGVWLAPHGKTPMSPQLCQRQLAAGAWGLSFATVFQARMGVAAGARRIIIANQVLADADLDGLSALLSADAALRVWFLVDSLAQLALIEDWAQRRGAGHAFDVLLEMGITGQRTGCRNSSQALALARALAQSKAVRLGGIECYEGGLATCDSAHDSAAVTELVRRVMDVVQACQRESLWNLAAGDEVIISAGGSAVFDLVIPLLQARLEGGPPGPAAPPVRGVLRSGCYLTHDHGNYRRFLAQIEKREGLDSSLQAALCVWSLVQSVPEPGLALLTCGRRDISYDQQMPIPTLFAAKGQRQAVSVPEGWKISALNDQHAYLRFDPAEDAVQVGDRVALGISHPCTTFDKWRWMPLVDSNWTLTGAISTAF